MKDTSNYKLDSIDLTLIKELSYDAKQTADTLSKKMGKSRSTIQGRVQRLLKEKVIRVVPIVDPVALGYEIAALFGINTLPEKTDTIVDQLASEDHIYHALVCGGHFNIMVTAVFENFEMLSDFVRIHLNSISGITAIDTMMVLKMIKPSVFALTDEDYLPANKDENLRLDSFDLSLINELRHDARQSQAELAVKLGASATTIRRRMHRLLENNVLKMIAVTNPRISIHRVRAAIGIKTYRGKIFDVASELASLERITHAVICAGRYDIMVWADFDQSHEFSRFIIEDLSNIQSIRDHETMMIIRAAKEVFSIPE